MRTSSQLWVATAAASLLFIVFPSITADVYINHFAVHVEGGHVAASRVARETGMVNLGQIGSLHDHYLFEFPHRERRSDSPHLDHHRTLTNHGEIVWFEQQVAKSRKKRDFHPREVAEQMSIIDPYWKKQWYLHGGGAGGFDMDVIGAWKKGYTGKNIVVTILDDGLERDHPDLIKNYDPHASYDVNSRDTDPMPRYDPTNENRHGTRCAGEVSAQANNTHCTIGIAPDSKIGGVRMLDGEVYDAVEAASLSFNRSHIDIYSASWGPDDDGKVVDGPGKMAKKAFIDGIHLGRGGKGSIFVWASGNGGSAQDSCNCDGYANSIFTLSISSTSENGRKPWYLEECSSTLATTYSSGSYSEKRIATTDLHKMCTDGHTGTSASAPLAAGIVAMVLEANKDLTWRDVQYITLMTSRPEPMMDGQWVTNGVGRKVSLRYGYGLMDASAMVDLALLWKNVPPKQECLVLSSISRQPFQFANGEKYQAQLESNGCHGLRTEVNYLEHVQARLSLNANRRGDLVIYLTSPKGTRSKILPYRPNDALRGGFDDWAFLSVHFWGENPTGTWTLEIDHGNSYRRSTGGGTVLSWSLVFHGTKDQPVHLKNETYKTAHKPLSTTLKTTATTSTHKPMDKTLVCHKECDGGCSGTGASDCLKCKKVRVASTKECVSSCPAGTYEMESTCMSCDSSCATCSGPTLNECLSCRPGLYYEGTLHVCFAECNVGFYKNKQACSKCHTSCGDCQGSSTSCVSCQHGRKLHGKQCISDGNSTKQLAKNVSILILCISIASALVLVSVLGIMFAKNNEYLCWADKGKYGRVPEDDKEAIVHLTYSDDFDEDYGR